MEKKKKEHASMESVAPAALLRLIFGTTTADISAYHVHQSGRVHDRRSLRTTSRKLQPTMKTTIPKIREIRQIRSKLPK
jgi:hypothetical protein